MSRTAFKKEATVTATPAAKAAMTVVDATKAVTLAAPIVKAATTTPASTATVYDKCHTGDVHVFDYVKDGATLSFFGGGTSKGSYQKPGQLLFALQSTDTGDAASLKAYGFVLPDYLIKYTQSRVLKMDVPDQHAPGVPYSFWPELLTFFLAMAKNEPEQTLEILVRCFGGHGRTGVVLCALAIAANACPEQDPIKWLRDKYCDKAVESIEQFEYIEGYSGIPSLELFSRTTKTTTSYTYGLGCTPPFPSTAVTPTKPTTTKADTTTPTTKTDSEMIIETTTGGEQPSTLATDVLAMYLVEFPESVSWSDPDGNWKYTYKDKSGAEQSVISSIDPLVAGVPMELATDALVDKVVYLGSRTHVVFSNGDEWDFDEEQPDESELMQAVYFEDIDKWAYYTYDGDVLLLSLPPTVDGIPLKNNMYNELRITSVDYDEYTAVLHTVDSQVIKLCKTVYSQLQKLLYNENSNSRIEGDFE
jgi:hypothetical protein